MKNILLPFWAFLLLATPTSAQEPLSLAEKHLLRKGLATIEQLRPTPPPPIWDEGAQLLAPMAEESCTEAQYQTLQDLIDATVLLDTIPPDTEAVIADLQKRCL